MEEIKLSNDQTIIWRNPKSVFKYNGWPTVTSDERGVLYATSSSFRIQHVDPCGKNTMFVSYNGGETWTKPIIINDSYLDDRDTGIIALGGGHMIANWFSSRMDEDYQNHLNFEWEKESDKRMVASIGAINPLLPQEDMKPGCYVMTSADYGVTWGDPIRVPMSAPHGPNKLNGEGRAVFLGTAHNENGEGHVVRCYVSEDYGNTWTARGDVPLPPELKWWNTAEPHVAQMKSGRLIGAFRVHGREPEPSETCYITFSDDEGMTWSEPKFIGITGLPPHLLVHSSGAVILSYADRSAENKSERAIVSYDEGETWSEDYVLNVDPPYNDLGYPATAECKDGSLFTVYYQCYPGDDFCSVLGKKWELRR